MIQVKDPNRVRAEDAAAHRWYRFILSFPPHLVRSYVDRFALSPADLVLDPFCGTGTTLVECKKLGIPSVGVERNPLAAFASCVKTDWSVDPDGLRSHAASIAALAESQLRRDGLTDLSGLPLFGDETVPDANLRRLPKDSEMLLLRDSISPLPLHKTLVLLEKLEGARGNTFLDHERLGLAKSLVSGISNVEFGPEVGVGRPKADAAVLSLWFAAVDEMAVDLAGLRMDSATQSEVHSADARDLTAVLAPRSVSAVITSPPYPNEKDYTRTTRLESVILGFLRNKTDLRELKMQLLRSNTRGVYRGDTDDEMIAENEEIQHIADAIERRRVELGKTSGFERMYPRVTKLYFGGMARHLGQLRQVLMPGAKLAYVVGDQASYLRVMIRTGELLGRIAESLGYEVLSIDLFRTRLATATREQLREEVLVLRWPG